MKTTDERIIGILERFGILPLNTISIMLDLPKPRTCKCLKSLEKWKIISKATIKPTAFYKLNINSDEKC